MTTLTAISLLPFCSQTGRIEYARPLRVAGVGVVATDKHIVVVALDHPKTSEFRIAYPNVYSKLHRALADMKLRAPYQSDQPHTRLDAMHLDPTPECEECHGLGFVNEANGSWCTACFGTGVQFVPIAVGAAHFQLAYLNLMAMHLPHCTLQLPTDHCLGDARSSKPTPFVFEGGYGWLAACDPKKAGARA